MEGQKGMMIISDFRVAFTTEIGNCFILLQETFVWEREGKGSC